MAQGRFSEAIPIYQSLVKSLPGNIGLLQNLAMAEAMSGHAADAIPHFKTVLQAEPDSIPALTLLSMANLQLNQPEQALPALKHLVALTPADPNPRGILAGAEMSVHRYADAAADYRKLTELDANDAKAWYGLGKAYESMATFDFDALTKLAPESAYVAALVADSRLQRGQYRSAFFFYREAEKRIPDLPGIHTGLADVYRKTGHADWAGEEQAKERPARPPAASQKEALLFSSIRKDNGLATEAFDHLGRLRESPELHALKAQILHDHSQDLEAAKEWRQAVAIASEVDRPRLTAELATSLFLGHDYAAAMPMLQDLLRGDPESPDFQFMLGESLWRSQQADQAIPHLEQALHGSPQMLPAHAALGLALASLNRYAEAIPHLEKAADLDDDGSLHYSLARAYQSAGKTDQANRNMAAYRAIQKRNADINGELAKEAEIIAPVPAR